MIDVDTEEEKEMVIDTMAKYNIAEELYEWIEPVYCLVATNHKLSVDNVYNLADDVLRSDDVSEVVPVGINECDWEYGRREIDMNDIERAIGCIEHYYDYRYMYLVDGSGTILSYVDMDVIRKDSRHMVENSPKEPCQHIDLTPQDDDEIPF